MNNLHYALGIDIGGTKIAFVIVDERGNIHHQQQIPTEPETPSADIIARIGKITNSLCTQYDLLGIGIGSAGYVDSERGIVRLAVNLGWRDVRFVKLLKEHLTCNVPITIMNDVDALMLGEVQFGAARGAMDLVYLAIGTGLGAAALSQGRRIIGARYAGMEIGHMPVPNNHRRCACGKSGCLETSLSGLGLLAIYKECRAQYPDSLLAQADEVTTHDIIAAMQTKDILAQVIRHELVNNMTHTLLVSQSLLDPEQYIIGGGLGKVLAPLILPDVRRKFREGLGVDVAPQINIANLHESAIGATVPIWWEQVGVR